MSIEWTIVDKYSAESDCKTYCIVKNMIEGKYRYIPYYLPDNYNPVLLSNGLFTVEAAKTVCETHKKAKKQ